MRGDVSGPELTVMQGKTYSVHVIMEVEDDDEVWINVSNRFIAADVSWDIDQHAASVVMTFARDDEANTASLSPLRGDSSMNAVGPLMTAGRRFRIKVACVALAVTPVSGDFHELVTGRFDKPSFADTPMRVEARDLGGLLIDTIAIEEARYGTPDDPVPAADAAQQYLTDNVGASAPTLVDESGTDYVTTKFIQVNVPVLEGLNALATQAGGLVVRYKYDDAGVAQLTMYDPLRANTTADITLTPSRYIEIPEAAIDQTNIRNIIRAEFLDPVTGEITRLEPDTSDPASIAAFGPRFMQLGADVFEGMTGNEVLTVVQAALSDLKYPKFDHHVTRLLFWPAEVGDIIEWAPNDVHYDVAQTLAVVGVQHHLEQGHGTTTFLCRGTPAGAYLEWIRRQGTGPTGPQIPPAPVLMFLLGELSQFGGTVDTVDGGVWLGYRMPVGVDEIRVHVLLGDGEALPVPNLDATTLALTIRRPEGDIAAPPVGDLRRFGLDNPGEYASIALLSTDPQYWKRVLFYGVRGGLTSKHVIPRSVQAVDPVPARADGTIASISVVRSGTTNTVTVTPGTLESGDPTNNGNWLVIMRNKHCLPPFFIEEDTSPVVFEDTGLEPSAAAAYVYEAFIWNGGQSGPLRRTIAEGPTITPPEFALGTPVSAIVANEPRVQISWTATTPGASSVRVEASLDGVAVRTVGTGSLASGTVYDTALGTKIYRLVALDIASNPIAYSPWKQYTTRPPIVFNPGAIPVIVTGYPKAVIGFVSPFIQLELRWTCGTPGAALIQVQRSTTGSGGTYSTVPNGTSGDVSAGSWKSESFSDVGLDAHYRVRALAPDGSTVLATSLVVHYIPPA